MYHQYYSKEEQYLYINRVSILEKLENCIRKTKMGANNKLALLGTRRVGKTQSLFELIRRNAPDDNIRFCYINLQNTVLMPALFAKQYVANILYWILNDESIKLTDLENLTKIVPLSMRLNNQEIMDYLIDFSDLYARNKTANSEFLKYAFSFPQILQKNLGKSLIVIVDEFQDLLKLNQYKGVDDVLEILKRKTIYHNNILYIFAGSMVKIIEQITNSPKSALFNEVTNFYIDPFDESSVQEYMEKKGQCNNFSYSKNVNKRIFKLTLGHPFYVYLLSELINQYHKIYNLVIDEDIVNRIFIKELINPTSIIYNQLNYLYEYSLGYAQGSNLLRAILKVLAESNNLRITDIAKVLYRERSEILIALQQLEKVDLVFSENKTYSIKDKVLRFWLKNYFNNMKVELELDSVVLSELVVEFMDYFLKC